MLTQSLVLLLFPFHLVSTTVGHLSQEETWLLVPVCSPGMANTYHMLPVVGKWWDSSFRVSLWATFPRLWFTMLAVSVHFAKLNRRMRFVRQQRTLPRLCPGSPCVQNHRDAIGPQLHFRSRSHLSSEPQSRIAPHGAASRK